MIKNSTEILQLILYHNAYLYCDCMCLLHSQPCHTICYNLMMIRIILYPRIQAFPIPDFSPELWHKIWDRSHL